MKTIDQKKSDSLKSGVTGSGKSAIKGGNESGQNKWDHTRSSTLEKLIALQGKQSPYMSCHIAKDLNYAYGVYCVSSDIK